MEKQKRPNNRLAPEEKLARRIGREFKKCRYIGDIQINDEEYEILKEFLRKGYANICSSFTHESINPLLAVALVQIGIRYYDGRFWNHVRSELGTDKLPANHQNWIGTSFYKTLIHYNKYHVEENQFMNNILMHCFVTKHYANDLFDFLFAYYQIDLDRDLSRNNKEMRSFLMQAMAKGESTKRAYKIRKHTSDAVLANEKGCKIRVGRILRFMDNALFNNTLPINSRNRIAQYFCEWADNSQRFEIEKKRTYGLTRKGIKRFSTPYIHFDGGKMLFNIVLPPQYIRLGEDEELPVITWKICIDNEIKTIEADVDSCVTGCKTEKIDSFRINSGHLFCEINIEIYKNEIEREQRFRIVSDSVRFFDENWDMIDPSAYSSYLPTGQLYAFTEADGTIVSDSDAIVSCERVLGYNLYNLLLTKGNVLRLPSGKAKSSGKPLDEGILLQDVVYGAYVIRNQIKYHIYSSVPSIYIRMNGSQEAGTIIGINGNRYRFDIEKCVCFELEDQTDEKGYILMLNDYISSDGIYDVFIDIPNSRKERIYSFSLINRFGFDFAGAPYVFNSNAVITFKDGCDPKLLNDEGIRCGIPYPFTIDPQEDYLSIKTHFGTEPVEIHVYVPAFKWKFDDEEWEVDQPEEIWHKEFPSTIYVKYPDDEITFSMSPLVMETSDDDENNSFSVTFAKDKENHLFTCDTRKMLSWFGNEEAIRDLVIELGGKPVHFAYVVTRCILHSAEMIADIKNSELVFKADISGFSDVAADIYYYTELIAEKHTVSTKGIRLKEPFRSGKYTVVFYEWDDDDEDDFGFSDYQKFGEKIFEYKNPFDLVGKEVFVRCVINTDKDRSIFAPTRLYLQYPMKIDNIKAYLDEAGTVFVGRCFLVGKETLVKITFPYANIENIFLTYYDEDNEVWRELSLDTDSYLLVRKGYFRVKNRQCFKGTVLLEKEHYCFIISIRKR